MNNTMRVGDYTATMTFAADDKIIVGRALGIDNIIVFHAKSVSEFEKNFQHVIKDYVAACAKLGSEPEKPASGKLMLRIAPEVHAAALKAAKQSGISLNKWAEKALVDAAH